MSNGQWENDYQELLRSSTDKGEVIRLDLGDERRVDPRFRLQSEYIWVRVQPKFSVVDVSVSGISFFANVPFGVGAAVEATLGKAFSIEVTVVACDMVESDADFMEAMYHVRCRFSDVSVGMQFLVMIKEMDELKKEGA